MANSDNRRNKRHDVLLTHYQACEILGISVDEIRSLVRKGVLNRYELDMRGRFKVSMREVNRLIFAMKAKGKNPLKDEEGYKDI